MNTRQFGRSGPLAAGLLLLAAVATAEQPQIKQVLSDVYTIEKKYLSMEGPASVQRVHLGDPAKPELVWLTAIRTEVMAPDGKTRQSPELMCHMNVDLDAPRHQALFNVTRTVQPRLVTVSQGMITAPGIFEARVPEGFGFPLASNEALLVYTQVLNLNIEKPRNIRVRHRVTFEYLRDSELKSPIKPLFNLAASGMVVLHDNPLALPMMPATPAMGSSPSLEANTSQHGASCLVLPRAPNAAGMNSDYVDPSGRKMTGHWVVPPGRQVNHSDVSWFMGLPYDTTVHYAAVHLHPFAKSLTLRDATSGKTVFEAKARSPQNRLGLTHVDSYANATGFRLEKNAQYQLISVYENPLDRNVDSMASMFFGAADPEFVKPTAMELSARAIDYEANVLDAVAIVRTSIGDFGIEMVRDAAPETVRQFLRLARSGAYDGAQLAALENGGVRFVAVPLNAMQKQLFRRVPVETSMKHDGGTLSLCPGETDLTIVVSRDPSRDGRCSAFARIGPGAAVVRALSASRSPEQVLIRKIDVYENKTDAATAEMTPVRVL